jgi:hypothetical protein
MRMKSERLGEGVSSIRGVKPMRIVQFLKPDSPVFLDKTPLRKLKPFFKKKEIQWNLGLKPRRIWNEDPIYGIAHKGWDFDMNNHEKDFLQESLGQHLDRDLRGQKILMRESRGVS